MMWYTEFMTPVFSVSTNLFSLADTLECGQCFRFRKISENVYSGVALGRSIELCQRGEELLVGGISEQVFRAKYLSYFALDVDYAKIHAELGKDATLRAIIDFAPGIRVLRQPLFESLISFILSQNNNIKRITGIVERLCRRFGEELPGGDYDFPTPQAIAGLSSEDLVDVRCGYRGDYIIDAARRWLTKEIDADSIKNAPLAEARSQLLKIRGVGPKVADCVLLFGAGRLDAFPEDVWIKRAMREFFPDGLPAAAAPYAGVAQQYIFHYARATLTR
ncbi:MAG: DNA-3-methyladenine glycosylase 2 family protein [Oscillospiraceae bacterium]|nr:DNA-3-methyladenine glycosylase 2 family protein [Oscillospiraceae bacterium]